MWAGCSTACNDMGLSKIQTSGHFRRFRSENVDLRFCVGCRKWIDITRKDCFPLSRIVDTLDTLFGARWFSTLDLKGVIGR
jgi:hypothetical protein